MKREKDITEAVIKSAEVPKKLWRYESMMHKKACPKKKRGTILK